MQAAYINLTIRNVASRNACGVYPGGSGIESRRQILLGEDLGDLSMARNGFRMARLRVLPSACSLPSLRNTQPAGEDAETVPQASFDYDEFLPGVRRQGTQ